MPALTLKTRLSAWAELMKVRLASLVVFSFVMTYLLAFKGEINWLQLSALCVSGFLITGASNIINQIIEKDLDALMNRTRNRPLPTELLSTWEAGMVCLVAGISGLMLMMWFGNAMATLLCFISIILYGFVYTPLKQKSPIAVLVGAIPGAMPPMIGWVAFTGHLGMEALILFGIQFIWQFPHFWAIAWVLDDDYKKAGFKLLPSGGGRDTKTAFTIMIYTLFLLPLGLLPYQFGLTGITSAIIATVCGCLFLIQTFALMRDCSIPSAKRIMFGSFIYLPVVQIAFVLDKV